MLANPNGVIAGDSGSNDLIGSVYIRTLRLDNEKAKQKRNRRPRREINDPEETWTKIENGKNDGGCKTAGSHATG